MAQSNSKSDTPKLKAASRLRASTNTPANGTSEAKVQTRTHPFWAGIEEICGAKTSRQFAPESKPDARTLLTFTKSFMNAHHPKQFELAMYMLQDKGSKLEQATYRSLLSLVGRVTPNQEKMFLLALLNRKNLTAETLFDLENLPRFSHPGIKNAIANHKGTGTKTTFRDAIEKVKEVSKAKDILPAIYQNRIDSRHSRLGNRPPSTPIMATARRTSSNLQLR